MRLDQLAWIDRGICGWLGVPQASRPRDADVAIIGSLGFALVGDVLYVRLLCPGKRARAAS